MNNLKVSEVIKPYFNYYLRKYPIELLGNCLFVDIPINDGSSSLDFYFVNVLLANGFKYNENWLLRRIYLTKSL